MRNPTKSKAVIISDYIAALNLHREACIEWALVAVEDFESNKTATSMNRLRVLRSKLGIAEQQVIRYAPPSIFD